MSVVRNPNFEKVRGAVAFLQRSSEVMNGYVTKVVDKPFEISGSVELSEDTTNGIIKAMYNASNIKYNIVSSVTSEFSKDKVNNLMECTKDLITLYEVSIMLQNMNMMPSYGGGRPRNNHASNPNHVQKEATQLKKLGYDSEVTFILNHDYGSSISGFSDFHDTIKEYLNDITKSKSLPAQQKAELLDRLEGKKTNINGRIRQYIGVTKNDLGLNNVDTLRHVMKPLKRNLETLYTSCTQSYSSAKNIYELAVAFTNLTSKLSMTDSKRLAKTNVDMTNKINKYKTHTDHKTLFRKYFTREELNLAKTSGKGTKPELTPWGIFSNSVDKNNSDVRTVMEANQQLLKSDMNKTYVLAENVDLSKNADITRALRATVSSIEEVLTNSHKADDPSTNMASKIATMFDACNEARSVLEAVEAVPVVRTTEDETESGAGSGAGAEDDWSRKLRSNNSEGKLIDDMTPPPPPPPSSSSSSSSSGGNAAGVMYRKYDEEKGLAYAKEFGKFVHNFMEENLARTWKQTVNVPARKMLQDVEDIEDDFEADKKVARLFKDLYEQTRRECDMFFWKLARFFTKTFREGFFYMNYWSGIPDVKSSGGGIKVYDRYMNELMKAVEQQVRDAEEALVTAVTSSNVDNSLTDWTKHVIDVSTRAKCRQYVERTKEVFGVLNKDVIRLLAGRGIPLRLTLFRSPLLLMYLSKASRIFFTWAALRFAERLFNTWYVRRVYGQGKSPPNPLGFVGLFLAFEAVMTALLLVAFLAIRVMAGDGPAYFPVNATFFKAFLVDYVYSTLCVFAVTAVLAAVIRKKKYFRYRYEGERGLRALSTMTFYVAVVLLLVPFFRLVV